MLWSVPRNDLGEGRTEIAQELLKLRTLLKSKQTKCSVSEKRKCVGTVMNVSAWRMNEQGCWGTDRRTARRAVMVKKGPTSSALDLVKLALSLWNSLTYNWLIWPLHDPLLLNSVWWWLVWDNTVQRSREAPSESPLLNYFALGFEHCQANLIMNSSITFFCNFYNLVGLAQTNIYAIMLTLIIFKLLIRGGRRMLTPLKSDFILQISSAL